MSQVGDGHGRRDKEASAQQRGRTAGDTNTAEAVLHDLPAAQFMAPAAYLDTSRPRRSRSRPGADTFALWSSAAQGSDQPAEHGKADHCPELILTIRVVLHL